MKGDDAAKWERIRCLRHGAFLRLFRYRWGNVLPNDDAGRDDLWLLVMNVSLAAAEPQKKMHHVIEMWAPWMPSEDREAYVKYVWGLDRYERIQTGEELGRRLGVTNAEREALKLWQFKPIDMTDEQLVEQAKRRERERRAQKRRAKGVRTREAYLGELTSRPKPWIAQGISRRTWERHRKMTQGASGDQKTVTQGESEIIVFKQRTHVATPNLEAPQQRGSQESALVQSPRQKATAAERRDMHASSSPEHRTDPATAVATDSS